jgi:ion channel
MNLKKLFSEEGFLNRDRTSKLLLVSMVLFFILAPLVEDREVGKIVLILDLYVTLVAATMELAARPVLLWSAIPIAVSSMVLLVVSHVHSTPALEIANGTVLAGFLILVSVSLYNYLGHDSAITKGRLYASVSLYFMLGLSWFAMYRVINFVQPGSFNEGGVPVPLEAHWSTFLYFSLTTLTTLGYGDIVAVKPAARMFATLEAATGVLYIAITVARLVAARHTEKTRDQQ